MKRVLVKQSFLKHNVGYLITPQGIQLMRLVPLKNGQRNFGSTIVCFSLGMTSSRPDANTWSSE
jgi:hypothetical protein